MPASLETPKKYDWEKEAKRILKVELARAGVSHKVLVARLERLGIKDTSSALASRISRGKFSFVFFLQCMEVLGVKELHFAPRELKKSEAPVGDERQLAPTKWL